MKYKDVIRFYRTSRYSLYIHVYKDKYSFIKTMSSITYYNSMIFFYL